MYWKNNHITHLPQALIPLLLRPLLRPRPLSLLLPLLPLFLLLAENTPAAAKDRYESLADKSALMFNAREWASASALYGLMLDERPESDTVYVSAIVSASLGGQPGQASDLLVKAMSHGVGFSRLMSGVKQLSFSIGEARVYEDFLIRSLADCPWLKRPIDDELLRYYLFRNDGCNIVRYATLMLDGLPDSVTYLSALADGYVALGRFTDALHTWQRILAIAPHHYDTLLRAGNYLAMTADTTAAVQYLTLADSIRHTPYLARRIAALDRHAKKH